MSDISTTAGNPPEASAAGAAFAQFMQHSPAHPLSPSLVLYATVTGQSEGVAREIQDRWHKQFPIQPIELLSTEQFMTPPTNIDLLPKLRLLICVISTTGNGEEPDSARKFLRELRKKGKGFLTGVKAVVCALGSSDYSQFCEAGMKLRRLLTTAGVTEIMPITKLDDTTFESDRPKFFETFEQQVLKNKALLQPENEEKKMTSDTVGATPASSSNESSVSAPIVPISPDVIVAQPGLPPPPHPADSIRPLYEFEPLEKKRSEEEEGEKVAALPLRPLHESISVPVSMTDLATAKGKGKDKENRIIWMDEPTPVSSVASSDSSSVTDLPSYYKRRWGNLDAHGERATWGTEAESPAFATLHGARYLTTPSCHAAGRMVVHMELEVPRGAHAFTYKPGDAVGIYCANDREMVEKLFRRLNITPEQQHRLFTHAKTADPQWSHLPSPCSILDAFMYGLDITASRTYKKGFIATLARQAQVQEERKALFALAGRDENDKLVKSVRGVKSPYDLLILGKQPTLLDLLNLYPSCQPDVSTLLLELPPLLPRSYSLSSAQTYDAGIMSIAWSKVAYESEYGNREGVCTKWMQQLCQTAGFLPSAQTGAVQSGAQSPSSLLGALRQNKDGKYQIPVFRKHSAFFALPEDTTVSKDQIPRPASVPTALSAMSALPSVSSDARMHRPIIMVGPGTGVAPFRGFLQQRLAHKRAVECDAGCDGEWRTLDHLAAPAPKPRRGSNATADGSSEAQAFDVPRIQPPMCNANGTITATNSTPATSSETLAESSSTSTTSSKPLQQPKKAVGHYDTPEVVFDDAFLEWDSRFGDVPSRVTPTTTTKPTVGPMYLFFGCRRPDWDYLYATDFAHFIEKGVLTQFSVAFSREEPPQPSSDTLAGPVASVEKFYVQHRMKMHGAQIADLLLNQDAYLYVCGDGLRMSRDVSACLKEILIEHGGKTPLEADALILHWVNRTGKEPTYIEDIWT